MGGRSKNKHSAEKSLRQTQAAHAQNMAQNPGIQLDEALGLQANVNKRDLGALGAMIDEMSSFGSQVFGANPIMQMRGSMMGAPMDISGFTDKLGLSDMIANLYPEEEKLEPTKGPSRRGSGDPFADMSPEERARIGIFGTGGRGFM